MKKTLLSLTCAILFAACATSNPNSQVNSGNKHGKCVFYEASLPCADCSAIKSSLMLMPNGEFSQKDEFINKGYVDTQKGKYVEKNGIIFLRSGDQTTALKRVNEGLLMLNSDLSEPQDRASYLYKTK